MLKKSGRKISMNRQLSSSSSSKQNAIRYELQKRYTDGELELTGLQKRKYPENKRPGRGSPPPPM